MYDLLILLGKGISVCSHDYHGYRLEENNLHQILRGKLAVIFREGNTKHLHKLIVGSTLRLVLRIPIFQFIV